MKRIPLIIDCCADCIFYEPSRKECTYAEHVINGIPIKIKNSSVIDDSCALVDSTVDDTLPVAMYYRRFKDGTAEIFVDDSSN